MNIRQRRQRTGTMSDFWSEMMRRVFFHVFLALDLTEETLEEAVQEGADMIITHHPMIFGGIKRINNYDSSGRKIYASDQE